MPTNKLPQPANGEFFMNVPGWQNVEGRVYVAFTNKGRPIHVWSPAPGNPPHLRYFCHGHTLRTYQQYNYSVFSGDDVLKVLNDEYTCIGQNLANVQQGDVISWQQGGHVIHTALVVNCQQMPKTIQNVTVWTKNGANPESVNLLFQVLPMYGNDFMIWRPD
jgi:hypothetical protein